MQITRLEEWDCLSIEITNYTIRVGFHDTGEPFSEAEMHLEGIVLDTRYDQPKENTSVRVDIEFATEQERTDEGYEPGNEDHPDGIPEGYDLGANYIGHINVLLPSGTRTDVAMSMHLRLPLNVFPLLTAMKGAGIRLSTVHDSIVSPKVDLNSCIVGYVKRAYFEPMDRT